MPGGNKNIKPEDGVQFKPGESGNPAGRPPKLLNQLNNELKEQGYKPLKESQIIEAYLLLLNMKRGDIKKLAKSGEVPAIFEIAAKGIGGKRGLDAVEKLLERAIGKAQQRADITSKGEKINDIDYSKLSDGVLDEILAARTDEKSSS